MRFSLFSSSSFIMFLFAISPKSILMGCPTSGHIADFGYSYIFNDADLESHARKCEGGCNSLEEYTECKKWANEVDRFFSKCSDCANYGYDCWSNVAKRLNAGVKDYQKKGNDFWNSNNKNQTYEMLTAYINRFPDGKYIQQAKQLLTPLTAQKELSDFNAAIASRSIQSLQDFKSHFPSSNRMPLINVLIDTLTDIADFNNAKLINTSKSYSQYISDHPKGLSVSAANDSLNRQKGGMENIVFTTANMLHITEAYQSYLRRYPAGIFASIAADSLKHLEILQMKAEQDLFARASKKQDINLYREYAIQYPRGVHTQEVQSKLSILEEKETAENERQQDADELIQTICGNIGSLKWQRESLAYEVSVGERSGYPRYATIAQYKRSIVETEDILVNNKAKYRALTGKSFSLSLCPKNEEESSEEPQRYRRFVVGERIERGISKSSTTTKTTERSVANSTSSVLIKDDGVVFQCKKVEEKWPNGKLKEESYVTESDSQDIYHGVYKSWFENGNLKQACIFKNGFQNGLDIEWYENGNEKLDCILINGKMEDIVYSWDEAGKNQQKCTYEENIKKECH